MTNDFSGFIKRESPEYESWKERTNEHPVMKEHGDKIVKESSYTFFKIMSVLFFILVFTLGCFLFYLGYNGKFQSTYSNTINPSFNATVNSQTTNSFNMPSPIVNIYLNNTIINQLNSTIINNTT
jgi:hypothetical protein